MIRFNIQFNNIIQESSMLTWDRLGLWRNKTLFGIPTHNLAFLLVNSYMNLPYALAESTVDAYGKQADVSWTTTIDMKKSQNNRCSLIM